MELTNKHYIAFLFVLMGMMVFFSHEESPLAVQSSTAPVIAQVEAEENLPAVMMTSPSQGRYEYLEITEGCSHGTDETCVWAYAGPSTSDEKVYEVEKGMLLKVKNTVSANGQTWYHVYFDEWLRFPERTQKDWYVPAYAGHIVRADGVETLSGSATTTKRIVVDLSEQMLYAYDGDKLFFQAQVSTGEYLTPTPLGTFTIYKKTPTRYMQGPLAGVTNVPFDLPGVPWNMYFTQGGAVIHGTYWHNDYGTEESSGCVNLPPAVAKMLYDWAPVGTAVTIEN
jgi:hypothetical protein